jgi:hypothetical protein
MIPEAKQAAAFGGFSRPSDVRSRTQSVRRDVAANFSDWNETALRKLIDDLAGFATSRLNRHRRYL